MDAELKHKVVEACRAADQFIKYYYEYFDKKRTHMHLLYLEDGLLVWNGNGIKGKDDIQKFIVDLPTSDHSTHVLDAQPVINEAMNGNKTILIQINGLVRYANYQQKPFQQTFVIAAHEDKWKIVSDCYRLQEALLVQNNKDK